MPLNIVGLLPRSITNCAWFEGIFTMKKIPYAFTIFLFASCVALTGGYGSDWSDLDEGERKLFGSEKERKYPINAGVVEYERWENHRSFHFFWFLKLTEYPRYTMQRLLPFYYHLESRWDRREKKFVWFVVPYYRVRDFDYEYMTYFPFYTEKTRKNSKDWNILYLLYGGREYHAEKKESYFGVLPLFYHERLEYPNSNEYKTMFISPLFFRLHKTRKPSEENYLEFNFSPFHFFYRSASLHDRVRRWGIPLIPILYYGSDSDSRHFNAGWLIFDLLLERKSGTIRRSFLTPLWYYHHDAHPKDTMLITPLGYYHHKEIISSAPNEAQMQHEVRWWFPLVPLYYQHAGPEGTHRNALWIFDWHRNAEGSLSRLWIVPLAFYQQNSYFHFIPPLVYCSWQEGGDFSATGLWGYHHIRRAEDNPAEVKMRRWWAPIVPLVYSYSSPEEQHVNVCGFLFDIQWKNQHLSRFFSLPLWYYEHQADSENAFATRTASLFHFYEHKAANLPSGKTGRTTWWAPLFPLVYRSIDSEKGTHTNALWLFDWAHDKEGNYARFWFMPFVFHKRNEYFHLLAPLVYMNWNEGGSEYRAGIWGFEKTSPDTASSVQWYPIIPLYYHSRSREEGSLHNLFWLFSWSYGTDGNFSHIRFWPLAYYKPGEGGRRYFLPFYIRPEGWTQERGYSFGLPLLPYYCRWEGGETKVRLWAPVYWSWNDITLFGKEHTSGSIVLPLWISYKDESHELDIYLYGGSKSVSIGPLAPTLTLGLGKGEKDWYMDTEWSWLYNAFSISTRTPIRNPFAKKTPPENRKIVADDKTAESASAPHMKKRREISRDNSVEFWGIKLLFGWLCYEHADSQRHFRLFPLAWYSWDEASDNKIINFLLYFYSKSGDQVYHVLFPLYGLSRDGDSYFNAYLLNVFWSEYDAEHKRRELTFFWPLVNVYWTSNAPEGSGEESGWRLFPLIWHKNTKASDGYQRSRTISLLYYGYSSEFPKQSLTQRMMLSPLWYYWKETSDWEGASSSSKTFFFPIIPLYYSSTDSRSVPEKGARPAESSWKHTNFIIPLYYYSSARESARKRDEWTLTIPLLLFYTSTASVTYETDGGSPYTRTESITFFPGFYRTTEGENTHYNILALFDTGSNGRERSSYHTLIPLWYYSREERPNSEGGITRSLMIPLFPFLCMYEGNTESGYLFLPIPFLSYCSWERDAHTTVLAGIFWKSNSAQSNEGFLHLLPFFMSWRHPSNSYRGNPGETDRTILIPFLPLALLYDGTPSNGYWFSPLCLSYYGWNGNSRRITIAGLFWKYTNENATDNYLHLLPFWMYWEDLANNHYYYFIPCAGLYIQNYPHYRRVNWLLLFDYEHWDATDTTELDFLFGIISTKRTRHRREFEIALGLIAQYENHFNTPDWSARLLWLGYERRGERRTFNIMPIFYFRSLEQARAYELYRFPLSFWHYETDGQDIFHCVGFGAVYYRNYFSREHRDRALVLGGILFDYEEKPERGYESWGSLWGFLWNYEREEAGSFTKFTLLKFLFKRVYDNGETTYRIMGIGI